MLLGNQEEGEGLGDTKPSGVGSSGVGRTVRWVGMSVRVSSALTKLPGCVRGML